MIQYLINSSGFITYHHDYRVQKPRNYFKYNTSMQKLHLNFFLDVFLRLVLDRSSKIDYNLVIPDIDVYYFA